MEGNALKVFWGITITGYVIGVIIGLNLVYSPDNYVYSRTCIEYSGPSNTNRYGDGPECEQYGEVKGRENILVPLIAHGGAGAFVAGWFGLFVAMVYEKYENKRKGRNTEANSSPDD